MEPKGYYLEKESLKMRIDNLLNEEICKEIENLKTIEAGTEAYKVAVDGVTKLLDRSIEMDKLTLEYEDRAENREVDSDLRVKQMDEEKKDRLIRNALTAVGIIVPSIITIWGTVKSIEFEKEGTITTIMGRGFIQKLLPKK